jgi:hypothetical protein
MLSPSRLFDLPKLRVQDFARQDVSDLHCSRLYFLKNFSDTPDPAPDLFSALNVRNKLFSQPAPDLAAMNADKESCRFRRDFLFPHDLPEFPDYFNHGLEYK